MKKLFLALLLALGVSTASAQTNEDVVKIVEQAVRHESAEDIHDFFLNCGFRLLEDEVAQSLGAERWETVYIDSKNRLYCWSKASLHDFWHSVRVKITFESWRSAQATFAACGYTALHYDEEREDLKDEPNKFILRKLIGKGKVPSLYGEQLVSQYVTITGDHITVYLQGTQCMVYARFLGPEIDVEG